MEVDSVNVLTLWSLTPGKALPPPQALQPGTQVLRSLGQVGQGWELKKAVNEDPPVSQVCGRRKGLGERGSLCWHCPVPVPIHPACTQPWASVTSHKNIKQEVKALMQETAVA